MKSDIEDLKDISLENTTQEEDKNQDSPDIKEEDNKKDNKNGREGKKVS